MVQVAPIKLNVGPKVLWFDPAGVDVHAGDHVIVSTERGHEFGECTSEIMDVSDELIAELNSPLKPVLRIASEEDEEKLVELKQRAEEALIVFRRLAQETNTDMHPVDVEFLFDGEKAVFFFEAEERVDFRELVRRLASEFHVRVDMRQIGVRDAARMIGGIGHCGQELCCRRMGGDFNPVTIRMAKEQGLSLNPQKISGCCGRLMCCLRYEFETYKEFNSRAPKLGAKIELPDGFAKVSDISMPTETITLRLEDGKSIRVPLDEFEEPEPGRRPHVLSAETYERYTSDNPLDKIDSSLFAGSSTSFTSEDTLADPERKPRVRKRNEEESSSRSRRQSAGRKPRRRASSSEQELELNSKNRKSAKPARSTKAEDSRRHHVEREYTSRTPRKRAVRPGQKSSGLRNLEAQDQVQNQSQGKSQDASQAQSQNQAKTQARSNASQPRSNRNRKADTRGSKAGQSTKNQRSNKSKSYSGKGKAANSQAKNSSQKTVATQAPKNMGAGASQNQGAKNSQAGHKSEGVRRNSGEHRRPRRRSSNSSSNKGSNNATE